MHIFVCIFAVLFCWQPAYPPLEAAGANRATPTYEEMLESARSGTFEIPELQPVPKSQLEEVLKGSKLNC